MIRTLTVVALVLASAFAFGQSTPATPLFTASSSAMAIELNGQYSVASDTAETVNITKTCGIVGDQLIAPTINLQGYYGGVACTPDFSALLAKTLIPPTAIQFSFKGSGGVVRNTAGAGTTNLSAVAGGCVTYQATAGGGFVAPICFDYLRAPGFGASANGWLVSGGIGWVFGH